MMGAMFNKRDQIMSHYIMGYTTSPKETKAVIEAVKASNARWKVCYPVEPKGCIYYRIKINDCDYDVYSRVYHMYNSEIVETKRKYSLFHKVKVWFVKKFN